MMHLVRWLPLALPLAVIAAGVTPTRADFYRLDGRFQCLDKAGALCTDATPSRDPAPPPQPPPPAVVPAPDIAAPVAVEQPIAKPARDPLIEIAQRIKAGRPESGDVAALQRAATAGDPRAVELWAWCALRGIGTGRDPVAAYFLYGRAAAAAVPHARENQALVYEQSLSQGERQRILEIEAKPDSARAPAADSVPGDRHVP